MKVLIGLSLLICIVSCSESIGKAKIIYKNAPSNGQVAKIGNQVLSENELRVLKMKFMKQKKIYLMLN